MAHPYSHGDFFVLREVAKRHAAVFASEIDKRYREIFAVAFLSATDLPATVI
jgi:hypothetical protein